MKKKKIFWIIIGIIGGIFLFFVLFSYTSNRQFESFQRKLYQISNESIFVFELVELGVYSPEKGVEELEQLSEKVNEIEQDIIKINYFFKEYQLDSLQFDIKSTRLELLLSLGKIENFIITG